MKYLVPALVSGDNVQAFSHSLSLPLAPGQEPRRRWPQGGPERAWCSLKRNLMSGEPEPGLCHLTCSPLSPQGYGVCSVGLERLAYLLVAYSLGATAASVLGLLGLWLPRQVPLVSGAGLHLLLTLGLFIWAPAPRVLQHIWILYMAAVLWGMGSALNKTGLSSEYSHGRWDGWAGGLQSTLGQLGAA